MKILWIVHQDLSCYVFFISSSRLLLRPNDETLQICFLFICCPHEIIDPHYGIIIMIGGGTICYLTTKLGVGGYNGKDPICSCLFNRISCLKSLFTLSGECFIFCVIKFLITLDLPHSQKWLNFEIDFYLL